MKTEIKMARLKKKMEELQIEYDELEYQSVSGAMLPEWTPNIDEAQLPITRGAKL